MKARTSFLAVATITAIGLLAALSVAADVDIIEDDEKTPPAAAKPSISAAGTVRCGNLIYGRNKTSKCFSSEFLKEIGRETNVVTESAFSPVKLESPELFEFPFCVMTGEGSYSLTDGQRTNLRNYLTAGGFVLASAGCSDPEWANSFRAEVAQIFPDVELKRLEMTHPVFHTIYEINQLECKKGSHNTHLEGLEIDGKIVLIFSSDGLNDTAKAGAKCCCCGGNEILNARQVNINLLAYTLTH